MEAIAQKHNLVARVWNDDEGKLSRQRRLELGSAGAETANISATDFARRSPFSWKITGSYAQLLTVVTGKYPDYKTPLRTHSAGKKESVLEFLDRRRPPATHKPGCSPPGFGGTTASMLELLKILERESGYGFRPLNQLKIQWSRGQDDYADVMRVMMIPQLQAIRRMVGLPSLDD